MVGSNQPTAAAHFFDQTGHYFGDVFLLHILKRPKTFHAGLVAVEGGVGCFEGADDGKHLRVFGFEGRRQSGSCAVLYACNDLPLIDQVGIAAQWRGTPCIGGHSNAGVRQGLGAHANFDTR